MEEEFSGVSGVSSFLAILSLLGSHNLYYSSPLKPVKMRHPCFLPVM
jgi:hypothetical protein